MKAKVLAKITRDGKSTFKRIFKDNTFDRAVKVEIIREIDGQRTTDFMETINPAPVVTNNPPVVSAGDDVIVKPNTVVILDGTVTDNDSNAVTVNWKQKEGPTIEPERDALDVTIARITTPPLEQGQTEVKLVYVFEAVDAEGNKSKDETTITVKEEVIPGPGPGPQPGEPGKNILWQTKGIWDNGKERELTEHHQFDPDDPTFEVAAGEKRLWIIDGQGHCSASGPRTRGYQHTEMKPGKLYEIGTTYTPNASLNNFSIEDFSRHNEEHPTAKKLSLEEKTFRYGGPTYSISLTEIKFQEEFWHNERDKKLNASKKLSQKLENGKKVKVRIEAGKKIEGDNVSFRHVIFINDVKEWEHEFTTNHPDAARMDALYWRQRVNGTAPKDVIIEDSYIAEITQ